MLDNNTSLKLSISKLKLKLYYEIVCVQKSYDRKKYLRYFFSWQTNYIQLNAKYLF